LCRYGTSAQLISILPPKLHAVFFVGTYSVSFLVFPINLMIGDLFSERGTVATSGTTATTGAASNISGLVCPPPSTVDAEWANISSFYGAGFSLNVLGMMGFVYLAYISPIGQKALRAKDDELRNQRNDDEGGSVNSAQLAGSIYETAVYSADGDTTDQGAAAEGEKADDAIASTLEVWTKCGAVGATMVRGA
jgi:hypothetical protein